MSVYQKAARFTRVILLTPPGGSRSEIKHWLPVMERLTCTVISRLICNSD